MPRQAGCSRLGLEDVSLFLANSAPFGVSLTMAVNCVVEKETALGALSYRQCCCQQVSYIRCMRVYKNNVVIALCVYKPVTNSGKRWLKIEVHFGLAIAFRKCVL